MYFLQLFQPEQFQSSAAKVEKNKLLPTTPAYSWYLHQHREQRSQVPQSLPV